MTANGRDNGGNVSTNGDNEDNTPTNGDNRENVATNGDNEDNTPTKKDNLAGNGNNTSERVDDWVYSPGDESDILQGRSYPTSGSVAESTRGFSADSSIGLAVGGANDINNFRRNVENGYLPSPADISHEGIFYDYFFDTGSAQACNDLFCPSYSTAISADPFSGQTEHFLAVGLNSNISAADFERKKLNLVIVLDISGSMSSSFYSYYYDQFRDPSQPIEEDIEQISKMEIANESLVALLEHLRPDDRLGIVLFDSSAYVAKDLRLVAETDMEAIEGHILEIIPQGGTNMEAGYEAGTKLLDEYEQSDSGEYENRIIFLTDAMPNLGNTNQSDLAQLADNNAQEGIYTSFIGIGLDFNAELIQAISQTQGANYFSVHSREDFKRQLDEGFEYMVTPLVFDLTLQLEADGYDIKAVYGSPEADLASGEIMKINTLFPSLRVDGQTRGGLVLLQLNKVSEQANLKLEVNYRDRAGEQHQNEQAVSFKGSDANYFDNSGIRKGVVLSRFVNVMEDWLGYEAKPSRPIIDYADSGIPVKHSSIDLTYWERTSRPLRLSPSYRPIFTDLKDYVTKELEALNDDNLDQELKLIDAILASPNPTEPN